MATALIAACAEPATSGPLATDSGSIAYVRSSGRTAEVNLVEVGTGRSRTVDVGEGRVSTPAWSPTGERLAYARRDVRSGGGFAIEVLEVATGERYRITPADRISGSPSWSPDGSSIAFSANLDGPSFDIYLVAVEGGAPRLLTRGQSPSWSSTGDLAFVVTQDATPTIYQIDPEADDAKPRRISAEETLGDQDPAWSPDGERLAVSTLSPHGDWDIAVIELGSGRYRRTELAGTDESHPTWSPNGAWIAFSRIDEEDASIWAMDPEGGGLWQITTSSEFDLMPTWRPDGIDGPPSGRTSRPRVPSGYGWPV